MSPLSALPMLVLSLLSCWHMLLFWASIYIMISGCRDRRHITPFLRNVLLVLLCFTSYTLFQCTIGFTTQNSSTALMIHIVEQYAKLPAGGIIAVCILMTAIEVYLILSANRWYNTHITSASIKETIETLPVGICAYEDNGKVILRNKTMEQLCRTLMGLPLLNGNEFVQMLSEKKSNLTDFAVSLPDYGVWSFTMDKIREENVCFTLLIAYNVTEEYQKTQILSERQKTLQELNRKLLNYNKRIESVITENEILNAKIHIHDELGLDLLSIKHYLASGGSAKERDDLLVRLRRNIRFLQQEAFSVEKDEYSLILSTSEKLGVSVCISGTLPQTEPNKHIIATAIHECFTNIIRHTDGDRLYVQITEENHTVTVQFSDNNTQSVSEIAETGGLGSLRTLTEGVGGKMILTTSPSYILIITLPKEDTGDVI